MLIHIVRLVITARCYLRFIVKNASRNSMHPCLRSRSSFTCIDVLHVLCGFEEENRTELKDYNYTKYSRGLSDLQERVLLV